MNSREARVLLADKLSEYRRLPYAALRERIGSVDTSTIVGPSGVQYQLEVQFVWDSENVRILGSIDDGGLRAFLPLCVSFGMAPDGKTVG